MAGAKHRKRIKVSKMTKFKLGMNCGFAINRFPEPEVWLRIVGKDLGLRYAQYVADLLNPFLPNEVVNQEIAKLKKNAAKYEVKIDTTFTSTFTRVNHLMHPDELQRKVWFNWWKRWFEISARLGARGSGGHFGILSVADFNDPKRRNFLIEEAINSWRRLAHFGAKLGFEFLIFEPMSIPREMACTIDSTRKLLERLNEGDLPIPIRLCLDVDHGDLASSDPRDTNPYAWLKELAHLAPVIHIKQSTKDKSAHWPFTEKYNKIGVISPPRVMEAIEKSGAEEVVLLFEISHRERYPMEYQVLDDLKKSVEYWRKYIKD
ncbi:D-erythrulose-1-phosphate dehydrogenase [Candidatus Aerophobetes bacterium]|uniref:D-erythrulose-1-phosphate dehydrogenase n=1 Tax=Aerophobetes bacterium TaxID=2030807 RepID=A0A662D7C1_UNCAE|nr:MAG: D-erythrulose-1-phosphate dehydrogenase [Candidatus Aerophobetes bacterium]